MKTMRLPRLLYLLFVVLVALPAAAQIGVWLPVQPPENGLGGWWELRADGSATYNWGALAEARYTFDGTILTIIPRGTRNDRPRFQLRFDGDRMYSRSDETGAPEAEYRRSSPATPSSPVVGTRIARLIGQWTSVAAPKAATSAMADMPGMTGPPRDMPSVRSFTANGVYQVRIVYNARQGHWGESNKTITLDGEPEQRFAFKDGSLTISGTTYRSN